MIEFKLLLIFLGILLIVIGYFGIKRKEDNMKNEENKKKEEHDLLEMTFKNAGIGSSKDILKQRATWDEQFEQKPGEIYDNIFNGKIIGLLSS